MRLGLSLASSDPASAPLEQRLQRIGLTLRSEDGSEERIQRKGNLALLTSHRCAVGGVNPPLQRIWEILQTASAWEAREGIVPLCGTRSTGPSFRERASPRSGRAREGGSSPSTGSGSALCFERRRRSPIQDGGSGRIAQEED
jgi:hypothetical protein